MIFSLASDIGKVRKNNEDFIDAKIICKDDNTKIGIFALADGMGGHNKGEVASLMAVNGIIDFLYENLSQEGSIKIDYFDGEYYYYDFEKIEKDFHEKKFDELIENIKGQNISEYVYGEILSKKKLKKYLKSKQNK